MKHIHETMPLLKVDQIVCAICRDVFLKPVTTPCKHTFCMQCFQVSLHHTTLKCPLCLRRCGTWWRRRKHKQSLINVKLERELKLQYPEYIEKRKAGENTDIYVESSRVLCPDGEVGQEMQSQLEKWSKQFEDDKMRQKAEEEELSLRLIKKILRDEKKLQRWEAQKNKSPPLTRQRAKDQRFRPIALEPKTPSKSNVSEWRQLSDSPNLTSYLPQKRVPNTSLIMGSEYSAFVDFVPKRIK